MLVIIEGIDKMDLKEIGNRIAKQRKIKGLTQENLAEKTKLSVVYISRNRVRK